MNQKQNRLNVAGSYYRVLPEITRRQLAIIRLPEIVPVSSIPTCGHAVVKRVRWIDSMPFNESS
ncbi:hypothetical protein [Ignatzschineria indica]|uniref:hypothetical protein n=1 Tax=Ignatzschineria indica TaxID=472583 RepID=UPI0010580C2E|nr:hypothetical protein [Ignatzschineria indica]